MLPTTYTVTYQMPGKPVVVAAGETAEGVRLLMNAVLLGGGWGSSMETERLEAVKREQRRDERIARGMARAVRARHYDAILRGCYVQSK